MFEIERKFHLTPDQEAHLIDGATFVGEKSMHDVYFDTKDFILTTKDWWLRKRDNRWELKIAVHTENSETRKAERYEELEDESSIRKAINLNKRKSLEEDLRAQGHEIVADVITVRRKYKKEGFTIDIDTIDFGYHLAEIERMVSNEEEMDRSSQEIIEFAKKYGLSIEKIRGKIDEYLRRFRPEHFQALVNAGVLYNDHLF